MVKRRIVIVLWMATMTAGSPGICADSQNSNDVPRQSSSDRTNIKTYWLRRDSSDFRQCKKHLREIRKCLRVLDDRVNEWQAEIRSSRSSAGQRQQLSSHDRVVVNTRELIELFQLASKRLDCISYEIDEKLNQKNTCNSIAIEDLREQLNTELSKYHALKRQMRDELGLSNQSDLQSFLSGSANSVMGIDDLTGIRF